MIKHSLVMSTLDREDCVLHFVKTLIQQEYVNWELVVVDQGETNSLQKKLNTVFPDTRIKYCKSPKGLSLGRNHGLKYITGDVISFPDDDSWYPRSDCLTSITALFDNCKSLGLLLVSSDDTVYSSQVSAEAFPLLKLGLHNFYGKTSSYQIFLNSKLLQNFSLIFDSKIGLGSSTIWGAGEDTDLVLRAIKQDVDCFYTKKILISHPKKEPEQIISRSYLLRAFMYSSGEGAILAKNNLHGLYLALCQRSLIRFIISLFSGRQFESSLRFLILSGRIVGYLTWNKDGKE